MLTHLGIICDGNRRWAKQNNLPVVMGHKKGLEVIEEIIATCADKKIEFLSFYVFSTENWSRSQEEVDNIMNLLITNITRLAKKMAKNNIKLRVVGKKDNVPDNIKEAFDEAEETTKDSTGTVVGFCFNYGGQQEIVDATNECIKAGEEVTIETINKHLYCPEIPPCDMIMRTSGEERISGFMLWRAAYSEFMFTDKFFPEIQREDIENVLEEYEKRNRRFGK